MRNIAVKIMYDGTNYHGWQTQNNGITVQETVENALSELINKKVSVFGCSRTDSGVHALEYVFNFKSETKIPAEKFCYAFNTILRCGDIEAVEAWDVPDDFSARFSSKGKTYVYKIWNSKVRNPFTVRYSYFLPYRLDIEKMKIAAKCFEGVHDFAGFMASGGSQKTTVRNIRHCTVTESYEWKEQIGIEVEADAFLYNMVRIISGTLAEVGMGRINPEDIPRIIESCDRTKGGLTAPPEGLFLKKVWF